MLHPTIIVQAQQGNTQAFRQIVEAYHGVVWRTARVLLRDTALTEDMVQEAWIDVWRGLPRLQHPYALRSWLLTVVANRCRMASRRSLPTTLSLESDPEVLLVPSDLEGPLEHLLRLESAVDLHTALDALPVDQQRVLALRYFADLGLSEIALVTAAPLGTVKSRLHRALQTLRASMPMKKETLVV